MPLRCAAENGVEAAFYGGWEGAERVQCCFYPQGEEPVFTGKWLQVDWNPRFGTVDHRALLGSLMSLGMDREMLGDLVIAAGQAFVRAMPEMAQRLPVELTRVGGTTVTVCPLSQPPALTPPKGMELRDTVASLRAGQRAFQRSAHLTQQGRGMDSSRAGAGESPRHGADGLPPEGRRPAFGAGIWACQAAGGRRANQEGPHSHCFGSFQ